MPTALRTHIIGVDFSGAALAGAKIWLAEGDVLDNGHLHVTACRRGANLPGSGLERSKCHEALRSYLAAQPAALVGMDFPFGLPLALVAEPAWKAFGEAFGARYPDPEAFRSSCALMSAGRHLRRATDQATRTPLAPTNLRIYRQTYFGIRDILAPLVREGAACVLPMQPAEAGRVWIVEACPASALKAIGCYPHYKGPGPDHRAARARILAALNARGLILADSAFADLVIGDPEGDALDAMIAALITARLSITPPQQVDLPEMIEGEVYCGLPDSSLTGPEVSP